MVQDEKRHARMSQCSALALSFFFLIPLIWIGLTKLSLPLLPFRIQNSYRVAGVFETSSLQAPIYCVQVNYTDPEVWGLVDERTLFDYRPLGNRTRFQGLMEEARRKGSPNAYQDLAQWIGVRLDQGSGAQKIVGLRLIRYRYQSELPQAPKKAWNFTDLNLDLSENIEVLYEYSLVGAGL